MPLDDDQHIRPMLRPALVLARSIATSLLVAASAIFPATATELVFDLKIEDGHIPDSMRLIRVKEGDVVMLRWTTDRPVVLHLHGYDIERLVTPGAVTELRFKATATGRFPVNLHAQRERADGRAQHEAPLVNVEVYPR
ncbi:MAG TPA: hypothetical protein VGU20_03595 [Stellaceae bacterium]|nr:hypothetical protein [Stellaceae bacterium]